ncbi:site-specific recombinase [Ideonella sp. A 288]|uniref:site-specific recombinase n=1 Tax=Ideonella sp. A 288 TaxID=1962181 RepID=UPI000B4AF39A|nr:site-specific recombinase [Ideonella sp. A 288]
MSDRAAWDLSALLNAADPRASRPERHLWLVRLVQWLRHGENGTDEDATPRPVLRLRLLLNALERYDEPRERIAALLARFWRETDLAALFADFGFTARRDLWGELGERLRLRFLPATPDTDDLAALFQLLFTEDGDAAWLRAIDDETLSRLAKLLATAHDADGRQPLLQAMTWLVSAIRSAAFAAPLRRRMDAALLADRPFEQLVRAGEALADSLVSGTPVDARQHASYLRALLSRCRAATDSVTSHLDDHGISVHIVFELEQLRARTERLEAVIDVLMSDTPQRELAHLLSDLVALARDRRSVRALLARQYSMLARKVAERHAETGEHYITRTRAEYRHMLRTAAGGGVVIAGTTFAKFAVLALGLAPFWAGFGAGLNYALSFLVIQLLHWTVATKQPAMTAPAMAEKLQDVTDAAAVEGFVDEVAHLVRSQMAGIVGNLAAVIPVVLAVQALAWWVAGRPLIGPAEAEHVLHAITLLGPTAFYAAFTGVLLFASSLIAGWVENWFVYHRLDSAVAHHPAFVARLGAPRAARWSAWWRHNISGVAANVSLGLLLGIVPALAAFVGLPLDVRHVTLSTGQLAAAVGALGWQTVLQPAFWWCVAGLGVTGALNLGVSFWLALKVALRSRGITLSDRRRLYLAVRQRLWTRPRSFFLPD